MISLTISHLYLAANFRNREAKDYISCFIDEETDRSNFFSDLILLRWKAYTKIKSSDSWVSALHLIHFIRVSPLGVDSLGYPQITFCLMILLKVNVPKGKKLDLELSLENGKVCVKSEVQHSKKSFVFPMRQLD